MLQTQTVERGTFSLLAKLMKDSVLSRFNLAGGTSLSLQIGHRRSIDLDLFTEDNFDTFKLNKHMESVYGFIRQFEEANTLSGMIEGVKIDLITFPYPPVRPYLKEEFGIRLYSMYDIAAMKLGAISQNGTRLKDFIDIACLSSRMSFAEMLESYSKKFPQSNPIIPCKALNYYDDINHAVDIDMIGGAYDWKVISDRLDQMSRYPERRFAEIIFKENSQGLAR